jgi:phosphoribosyl-ATP pyrophosphohydrolase/phosphoribosyl-AMP cyclohydrolase
MRIDFQKNNGLVPAIIQDNATLQILMLGYMNEEAFAKTQQEKKLLFLVVVKIAYGQKENPQATFYW